MSAFGNQNVVAYPRYLRTQVDDVAAVLGFFPPLAAAAAVASGPFPHDAVDVDPSLDLFRHDERLQVRHRLRMRHGFRERRFD